jgi:D-sedoheptulose 7-phosphate isomerase
MREISHSNLYFKEVSEIANKINYSQIEELAINLLDIRNKKGRMFILGVGGSAGNASHAVNDFRKLCGIESYAPSDNVSELSARANDEGWHTIFNSWLEVSNVNQKDCLFILSVGGGNISKNVSVNIVEAIKLAKNRNMKIFGIIGKETGYTYTHGDNVILIPNVNNDRITPHSEAFQSVVWHCLVCHPVLQINKTKW